jgi:tRNA1Val (adenine37-N6)-methyltransferase
MSNPYFSFRRFTVRHDRCAMKVGTDGVLLGAWARVDGARRILDVGTGTGLIALMLAQRTEGDGAPSVWALDIDADAVSQARQNVAASPWPQRILVEQQDICTYFPAQDFDLIVSNPPYFNALNSPNAKRNAARHTDSLSFRELAQAAARLLAPNGRFCVVIPMDAVSEFLAVTAEVDLFPNRQLLVRTKEGAPIKRSLLEFKRKAMPFQPEELLLEVAQNVRSAAYQTLAADFYL